MSMHRVGTSAWLVELESAAAVMALYSAARHSEIPASDIVPGARTVLFDGLADPSGLERLVGQAAVAVRPPGSSGPLSGGEVVELPTTYDGPDLEDTARLLGMSVDALVDLHTATEVVVAFCGFSPGFAYCTGLGLSVPRLDSPRARVAAGSVGLAGEFTGVYPSASPGGWRLIGRTDVPLWDLGRAQPALLSPGTRVRFTAP